MILLLDNYDSFTYNLRDYFLQLGAEITVVRNDEVTVEEIEEMNPQAIILSPGPERPEQAGIMMDLIETFHKRLSILGICLGHQALGMHFGAKLVKAAVPMHGKTSNIEHFGHPVFEGLPDLFVAMRYHSLILSGGSMNTIASTTDGEIMGIAHEHLPLVGLQFHPESVLTGVGLQLCRNWLAFSVILHEKDPFSNLS
ncbi:MAG: aminodeoxychorismate/anthranilate synthase component II [Bacteroidetes bacterium]|nr:aminodeoxychorismate/anthranilate synthase component II [Bacteroidota bacterium]